MGNRKQPTPPPARATKPNPPPAPPPRKRQVQLSIAASSSDLHSSCEVFATTDMTCPLCRMLVPARTPHRCGTDTDAGASILIAALARAVGGDAKR